MFTKHIMVILPLKINATTRQTITQVGIRIPIKTCTCIGKATIKLTKATKTKIRKKNLRIVKTFIPTYKLDYSLIYKGLNKRKAKSHLKY